MIEYRHHSPNKLSGGQKQRVAIAGVVAMCPKCIVLDEPTAMLDPNGRKEVLRTVEELKKKRTCDGYLDHALYGGSDWSRPSHCHGSGTCCHGRNDERDFQPSRTVEKI